MFKSLPKEFLLFKQFILPILTIFTVIVLSANFLIPKLYQAQEILEQKEKEAKLLIKIENKAKKLNTLANSSLKFDYEKMEAVLPSDKDGLYIIFSLTKLENDNKVKLEGLSLNPGKLDSTPSATTVIKKTENKLINNIDLNLIVIGSQDQVLIFLDKLTTITPLFNINSVNFFPHGDQSRLSIGISTYYQPLPKSIGKYDSSLPELTMEQQNAFNLVKNFQMPETTIEEFLKEASPSSQTAPPSSIFQ